MGTADLHETISLVRDDLHAKGPEGTKALVGGPTAIFADINSANNRDLSVILPVAAGLIALILALLLRSLVAPIYLVIAVLLNFAATLGATVYVFQGLQGNPGVTFQLPIILYLFVVAIGTDYNILMIARLREEAREGHEPHQAAAIGVEHAGPTVAAAGLILAGTFGVLMLAPISFLQQMGFAVAIGIVLSAFVMSMFFVPALTGLIGHTAWWPGHGDERRITGPHAPPEPVSMAGGADSPTRRLRAGERVLQGKLVGRPRRGRLDATLAPQQARTVVWANGIRQDVPLISADEALAQLRAAGMGDCSGCAPLKLTGGSPDHDDGQNHPQPGHRPGIGGRRASR
ncbi:MMPL family transporter [Micromonospora sp. WMMA1996]|uniref:MMPL family transporter n=1 Tax=Micromonospora sp. WMMA1996 TaxID=2039878 RepID=UPI0020D27F14|nr:MMPL family transporter [Micromonospora sp. WMMA1996]